MAGRPPSPVTPTSPSTSAIAPNDHREDRVVATTPQLVAAVENSIGYRFDEAELEELLLELDRREYVEWVMLTRDGDYVWDLSESADRIADAVATALVARFRSWLEGSTDE